MNDVTDHLLKARERGCVKVVIHDIQHKDKYSVLNTGIYNSLLFVQCHILGTRII